MSNATILTGGMKKDKRMFFGYKLNTKEVKLPKGWEQTCVSCPIQYSKNVKIGNKWYQGYLRSRWEYCFSITINELKKNGMWGDVVFEAEPLETHTENPPFRSMRLIDMQFRFMREKYGKMQN